ncbi:unnamed protein product [Caenorhabditis bovis]|uniref:G-protein coupled receptors family 1 profile domain-containing protein n=1 Tax=Caenorhabditis bovis TaxID=2654633 RepID=A0A8S1EIX9_9PELO|nr:unnamed protein product [Caenorhabditis bovis]
MSSSQYVLFFDIYYHFYAIVGLILQLFLLFLIFKKSPSSLEHLKYFLYNTCITQIALVLSTFSSQHRVLPNLGSTAILPRGPCKLIGPKTCFTMYHIYTALGADAGIAISSTVLFRYLVLTRNSFGPKQIAILIIAAHFFPFILLLVPFTDTWNFEAVRNVTHAEHPKYDLSIYEPFVGFADTQSIQFLVGTAILTLGAYCVPLISALLTRQVLVLIRQHQNMSDRTKKQATTLIYGLIWQTLFPISIYIPIYSCYLYTQSTGEEILLTEHLFLALASLPGLVDPLISFYFVVPYRAYILTSLGLKKPIVYRETIAVTCSVMAAGK